MFELTELQLHTLIYFICTSDLKENFGLTHSEDQLDDLNVTINNVINSDAMDFIYMIREGISNGEMSTMIDAINEKNEK